MEWIDINDRLPEFKPRRSRRFRVMRSHRVLVACSNGWMTIGMGWDMSGRDRIDWFDDEQDIIKGVTHWAEIPRHPINGKNTDESDTPLSPEEWECIEI